MFVTSQEKERRFYSSSRRNVRCIRQTPKKKQVDQRRACDRSLWIDGEKKNGKKKRFEKTAKRSTRDEWLFNDALNCFTLRQKVHSLTKQISRIVDSQNFANLRMLRAWTWTWLCHYRSMTFKQTFRGQSHVCHIRSCINKLCGLLSFVEIDPKSGSLRSSK